MKTSGGFSRHGGAHPEKPPDVVFTDEVARASAFPIVRPLRDSTQKLSGIFVWGERPYDSALLRSVHLSHQLSVLLKVSVYLSRRLLKPRIVLFLNGFKTSDDAI